MTRIAVTEVACGSATTEHRFHYLTDTHVGARDHAGDALRERIEEIRKDPNALWGGGGDYGDFIVPGDKRFVPDILDDEARHFAHRLPDLYLDRMQKLFAPIVDKCLFLGVGNHELPRWIIANAKAAFGLKQANSAPTDWPVMSVPHLLRLDEIGVEYIPGYPAGVLWINERLACIHGHKAKSNGSTAAAVIADERMSVLFGHVHRLELQHRTKRVYGGSRTHLAACIGCLSRTDGSVPSTRGAIDPMGRPVPAVEDWQQGFAVVTYKPGDSPFHVELVPIHDGEALFRGRLFAADALAVAA
jgi:hypothetical protein